MNIIHKPSSINFLLKHNPYEILRENSSDDFRSYNNQKADALKAYKIKVLIDCFKTRNKWQVLSFMKFFSALYIFKHTYTRAHIFLLTENWKNNTQADLTAGTLTNEWSFLSVQISLATMR